MAETAFAIGAFCVAAAIVGGGLKASHVWDMPVVDSLPRQLMLGSFGVGMIALGLLLGGAFEGDGPLPPTPGPTREPGGSGSEATRTASPTESPDPGGETPSGCEITIANPLVPLREEPANFAQEIRDVPPGTYAVSEVREVAFGSRTERWLEITVEGRTGWVKDDTFTVDSKSAGCP